MTELKGVQGNPIVILPSLRGEKRPPLDLKVGDRVLAEVVQKLEGDHYRIRLQNLEVLAESKIPLTEGDRIRMEVSRLSPRVVLTPLESSEA